MLTGLTRFNLESGDLIHPTVTLDGLFTLPDSGEQLFGLNLLQFLSGGGGATVHPAQPAGNDGSITFFNSRGRPDGPATSRRARAAIASPTMAGSRRRSVSTPLPPTS